MKGIVDMKVRKIIIMLVLSCCIFATSFSHQSTTVEAKATKKAMKFLKGTWITWGNSQAEKVVFTKKYKKVYSLWNKNHTKVYSPKKKGKLLYKSKIVSTKKKGKKWIIKVGKKGSYLYYKGSGDVLECWWKDKNGWNYSGSDSLQKVK